MGLGSLLGAIGWYAEPVIRFAGESVGNGWSFGGGRETFCRSPKTTRGVPASGRTDLRGERALDKDGGGCKTALSMVSG